MGTEERLNGFFKNVVYAFFAQGISLLLSIMMSLVVPKMLNITEYGYWQLFIFYVGYVGFFHFGLNDGLYLKEGGKHYSQLNYSVIGTQYWMSILFESVFSCAILFGSILVLEDGRRQVIFIVAAAYLVVSNATLFLGYIFQAVNKTKLYSISVVIDRVSVLCTIGILIILKINRFEPFIILYLLSKCVAFVYCIAMGKDIVFARLCSIKVAWIEMWQNISVGIKLMIANIMSMMILGCGRLIIDKIWGVESFGKFSFSLSLTNLFLTFISQISIVLFPALRQVTVEKQKSVYLLARQGVALFMPIIFILYMPVNEIISVWLPQYQESLHYLIFLLPLCIFDGKMQLLCNTYFKVLRKEKRLLWNNIFAFVISLFLSLAGGYIFQDIYFIILSVVVAIVIRSIVSEIYLSKLLGIKVGKYLFQEILISIIFMIAAWNLESMSSFIIIMAVDGAYWFMNRSDFKLFFYRFLHKSSIKK